ncbi:MAG: DUF4263 domain-containing protein [Candidatus Pacebacteria bacterium]|nr:DUF4263 domain-containing protein [Candidatus Parcubacteria bacterium]MCK5592315.1 DUF4263 domain-containing protein [Candidatus Paceibacterota bacterium]
MKRITDQLIKTLRNKKTVITKAFFWKIPHNSEQEDVRLKIGRYKKSTKPFAKDEPEDLEPKSELTLDNEELSELMKFIQDNYAPFKKGVKAFIPLDNPYDKETAQQIRALFSIPDKQNLLNFILSHKIIPDELAIALEHAKRLSSLKQFEQMLNMDKLEHDWQKWFIANSWVLGSEFVRILDERHIDVQNISDFLMEAYDGFLDIVEIKRPEGKLEFWSKPIDHGNYVPSSDLTKAITQASKYIYEVERESNSVKFIERTGNIKTVKPRCILIFGRSNNWNNSQIEAYRIMNSNYHNLTVMTYDHVLSRAKRIIGIKKS